MILTVDRDGDVSRGLTRAAVASAIRVIATDVVGCTDATEDGVTGLLVPPRDVGALVAASRRYVDAAT
jgi:glycosyltransferase involved in cell wall biosynthesis